MSSVRIIHKLVKNEERYIRDLDILLSVFLNPLYEAFMSSACKGLLDRIVELDNSHRRLLSALYARRGEDNSNQSIGDILLEASCELKSVYSAYFGFLPSAEKKMTHEMEENPDFRLFIEVLSSHLVSRNSSEYSPSYPEMRPHDLETTGKAPSSLFPPVPPQTNGPPQDVLFLFGSTTILTSKSRRHGPPLEESPNLSEHHPGYCDGLLLSSWRVSSEGQVPLGLGCTRFPRCQRGDWEKGEGSTVVSPFFVSLGLRGLIRKD